MRGVFSNANDIIFYLMIFPALIASCSSSLLPRVRIWPIKIQIKHNKVENSNLPRKGVELKTTEKKKTDDPRPPDFSGPAP